MESDAIVSPGNSFGFMDGGLDFLISKNYGWQIQSELRERISKRPINELLVGQAETIWIEDFKKYVICAPTMRVPTSNNIGDTVNAYLAIKAILQELKTHHDINRVTVPGLCTGTGKMPPLISAKQMYMAYQEIVKANIPEFMNYMDVKKYHSYLTH
ncbi:macro domain-containing protein [Fulvivirga ligni]|uniref:macro domain-containing protein n=1 Tax=Fulvivirga ligni TaxID=2904246 RepID=UPI001F36CC2A|nr:macro domain-containing protein [Fulvivirga ligni]UII20245.1 macro domain-containing protein [Fulvivirga ligni]